MKKQFLQRVAVAFCILAVGTSVPLGAQADDGYQGRYSGSAYQETIDALGRKKVKRLPVPVLFGVSLPAIMPNFGVPRGGGARTHEGEDIIALQGAPVISPTKAVVVDAGTGPSAGNYVTTANPGGERFVYMHLDKILVRKGDELKVGDIIGYVGNTGNAVGGPAHLHFEIRQDGVATDPFPRIAREFSLKSKIKYLKRALAQAKEKSSLVRFVTTNYQQELAQAQSTGITLPKQLAKALKDAPAVAQTSAPAVRDSTLGSQGPLISTLQQLLILKNTGPAAKALAAAGPTGNFGPITQNALVEYQSANGIPANERFGTTTVAYILATEGKNKK